jgi:YD repeat-containing protein
MKPFLRLSVSTIGCLVGAVAIAADTTTFTYDALGRLTDVQIAGGAMNGAQQSYQYDSAGNRLHQQIVAAAGGGAQPTTITPAATTLSFMGAGDVVLTANVGDTSAGGTVTLSFNDVFVGVAPVIDGVVRISFQGIAPGTYTVRAIYTGDASHRPTTSTFTVQVRDLSWLPAVLQLLLAD